MNAKSLAYGTIAGTVVLFVMGYVIYELLLSGTYTANMNGSLNRPEMDMLMIALSTAVYAFLLTYIFAKWAGIRTLGAGATAGAIIGLLITLSMDLGMYAMMDVMQPVMLVVDPIASAVWSACGGAAIGLALSKAG
jgi:hypothetical protein